MEHVKEILKQILSRYENNTFKLLRKEMYNDFVNKTKGEIYSLTRGLLFQVAHTKNAAQFNINFT